MHSLYRLYRVRRPVGGYGPMDVAVRAVSLQCSISRAFCGAGSSHDQAMSTLLQGQRRSEGARSAEGAHEEGFDAAWCSCFDAERAAEASGPCGQGDMARCYCFDAERAAEASKSQRLGRCAMGNNMRMCARKWAPSAGSVRKRS